MGMYPSAMANPGLHAVCTQLRSTYLPINRQVHTKHFTFHDLTSLPLPISTHTHTYTSFSAYRSFLKHAYPKPDDPHTHATPLAGRVMINRELQILQAGLLAVKVGSCQVPNPNYRLEKQDAHGAFASV
jgi:hypothetical protein